MSCDDVTALERFVLDNPELERLEALLDEFNPFVALRWTRQEIRHSSFLRWLADPTETHGLGAYFLRKLLKLLADETNGADLTSPSVIEIDSSEFSHALVAAEWNRIDLFVRDDSVPLVCVIENKIGSSEHSHQLQRYRTLVAERFPSHKQLYGYLTVEGETPSDEAYVPLRYQDIALLVEKTLERRRDQLSGDVASFLGHYVEMLRRHIVEDSEIQELCRRIYGTHRRALDILFEHRPDRASEMSEFLQELIAAGASVAADVSSKTYIRFLPHALDFLPREGSGWTKTRRILLLELDQSPGGIRLKFVLGPGNPELRAAVRREVLKHPQLFNRAETKFSRRWWAFHTEEWISSQWYAEAEAEELKAELRSRFEQFLATECPQFVAALQGLEVRAPDKATIGDESER